MDAVEQNQRLAICGLVYYDNQLTSEHYVGPPEQRQDGGTRIRVLPLAHVQPTAGLKIQATDGERYLLPHDFKGTWFDVVSPTNRRLIE